MRDRDDAVGGWRSSCTPTFPHKVGWRGTWSWRGCLGATVLRSAVVDWAVAGVSPAPLSEVVQVPPGSLSGLLCLWLT